MMSYERKIALLFFFLWAGAVLLVVWITLQSTHRSLSELHGDQMLQRFIRLPHRLFDQHSAEGALQSVASAKEGDSAQEGVIVSTAERTTVKESLPMQRSTSKVYNTLKKIEVQQHHQQWVYQLTIDSDTPLYHHFSLTKKPRWVLDLKGKWSIQGGNFYLQASGPVTSITLGKHPDHLRVVFQLREGVNAPDIRVEKEKLWVLFGKKIAVEKASSSA